MSTVDLDKAQLRALDRMLGTLWVIPDEKTLGLMAVCYELEGLGLCKSERPEGHLDGRICYSLTRAGHAALSPSPKGKGGGE